MSKKQSECVMQNECKKIQQRKNKGAGRVENFSQLNGRKEKEKARVEICAVGLKRPVSCDVRRPTAKPLPAASFLPTRKEKLFT